MGLNAFGKYLRKYRIDNSMLLKNMADVLKIGPAYLSGMETGSKPISKEIVLKIIDLFNFNEAQQNELRNAVEMSKTEVKVKTGGDPLNQELAVAFSRSIESLSREDKQKILEIVKRGK